MRRLSVRLVVSHVLAALLGAVVTFLIVRSLAPYLFDELQRQGWVTASPTPAASASPTATFTPGQGMGQGQGQGRGQGGPGYGGGMTVRQQLADAVEQALWIGGLVGVIAAGILGAVAASRFVRPIRHLSDATRSIARGDYDVSVPVPVETELAMLAGDVQTLGTTLAETEKRRVRLLGEVAHEMRTPLTVVDGYVEGMIDGLIPANADTLGQVSEEVRRLRRLSDDLSALSRAEEGRLTLSVRRVDLADVARGPADRLRPQAEDAGLTLAFEGSADAAGVDADPDRIAQVVTNLVGNAIRATAPGGTVSVAVRRGEGFGEIRVSDTGEGLAAEDLERVFERFYRVSGRRVDGGDKGSGIGLTIARRIMRAHGGDLTAASPGPGQGATFTARLPLAG